MTKAPPRIEWHEILDVTTAVTSTPEDGIGAAMLTIQREPIRPLTNFTSVLNIVWIEPSRRSS